MTPTVRAVAAPHLGLAATSAAAGSVLFILPFFIHRELRLSPSVIGATGWRSRSWSPSSA